MCILNGIIGLSDIDRLFFFFFLSWIKKKQTGSDFSFFPIQIVFSFERSIHVFFLKKK